LSCTDAGLEPLVDPVLHVDDELTVTGEFCTSRPDEVAFPVKLLIAIDQSASLQCTDPGNARLAALATAGAALDPLPNVEFGVVGFASWSRITPFTPDWSVAAAALAPANGTGGPGTDYQGALATVLSVLEQDMLDSGPAEVARTKYVVLFMSDGVPEPRCRAGCDDGDTPPDSLYGVCNTTEPIADEDYVDMLTPCPEYNQEPQILQKVQDIMALGEFHGVGDLTLSTILLFAPEEEIAAVCGDVSIFGYVRAEAEPLLYAISTEGSGTYRDINTSEEIDFLDFDYESLQAPYVLAELFALNAQAIPTELGIATDSDGDGIDDDAEFDQLLDRLSVDSDGDQYGDLLETRFATQGFDPLDGAVPATGCPRADDRDGDGLRFCEESFLTSDPLLPDSDADRIPDGVELRLGMDPTTHDTFVDYDLDGQVSGVEVRAGTHPLLFDEEEALVEQVRYRVEEGEPLGGGASCYEWAFEGLTLVPSLSQTGDIEDKGLNRILFFAEEEPMGLAGSRGRFHVACVEARYLGEAYKVPADGRIEDLSRYRFVEIPDFDPNTHCLELNADPTERPEWSWDDP
jgi:hypothetical protein